MPFRWFRPSALVLQCSYVLRSWCVSCNIYISAPFEEDKILVAHYASRCPLLTTSSLWASIMGTKPVRPFAKAKRKSRLSKEIYSLFLLCSEPSRCRTINGDSNPSQACPMTVGQDRLEAGSVCKQQSTLNCPPRRLLPDSIHIYCTRF